MLIYALFNWLVSNSLEVLNDMSQKLPFEFEVLDGFKADFFISDVICCISKCVDLSTRTVYTWYQLINTLKIKDWRTTLVIVENSYRKHNVFSQMANIRLICPYNIERLRPLRTVFSHISHSWCSILHMTQSVHVLQKTLCEWMNWVVLKRLLRPKGSINLKEAGL